MVNYTANISGNGVYIHCESGCLRIAGTVLNPGDALGAYEMEGVTVEALEDADIIFVEVPMQRGVRV